MDVTAYESYILRDLDTVTFGDLFASPAYTGWSLDDTGFVLHFDGDLTAEQVRSVRRRVYTTPEDEADRAALEGLQGTIDSLTRVAGPMNTTQLTEAVKALSNAALALYRLRRRDLGA